MSESVAPIPSQAPQQLPLKIVLRRKLEVLGARGLTYVVRRASRPRALAIADDLARFAYKSPFLKRNLKHARIHLEWVFGDRYTPADREDLIKSSLRTLARTMVDFMRFGDYSSEEFLGLCVKSEGMENYQAFRDGPHGSAIGLGMHIGSWEYMGGFMAHLGPMVAVGKPQREGAITALAVANREAVGIEHVLSSSTGSRKLIETLRRKDKAYLGLLADQNGGRDGLWVPYCGRIASCVRGPGFLMRRYKVPAQHLVGLWEGDQYRTIIGPLFHGVESDDMERDILLNTARVAAEYEAMLLRFPEQGLWLHKRWKSQPTEEALANPHHFILTPEEWAIERAKFVD